MAAGDRHRVVVGLVAHQRLRADPSRGLVAGVEGRGRQGRHRLQVPRQPRADRLGIAAQDLRLALAALRLEPAVEVLPGGEARQRHHEGAPRPADQPFDGALVVALAGPAVAVADQVVRQEPAEEPGPLAGPVGQDARHQAAVVVVEHRERHPPEEGEGVDVAVHPGLGGRRRIGADEAGVALRQVEGKEMRRLLDAADHHARFAEVSLGMARRVVQRHEHLPAAPPMLADVVLHDGVAADKAVLVAQPLVHPLRGVALLGALAEILPQPLLDDLGEPVQLRPPDLGASPIPRRNREAQHLPYAVAHPWAQTCLPRQPGSRGRRSSSPKYCRQSGAPPAGARSRSTGWLS